ncbi:14710_t:CDS:10 [Entrophospora sp. SA101]|nr:14710_t:CDS:10 [Entrophospora sp. SA101]CAJ0825418.1 9549_t:CDS:10 [Entrophospora sp. SA101]
MTRNSHLNTILGSELFEKISKCRVLMVGAGGIGCELLKNLVMSGFQEIELIDLDTIDLSNLNRQFLFQKQHIKKSKAEVARESALKFNPNVNITSHHANIKDLQFNLEWFKSFDIVMNALDNLDARRHVNKMCLAANVPLIESGTEGYLGQVTVIKKGETECYDCLPKPSRKTYAICTIRSTPSSPIHCIVWAKSYLFSQLFGIPEDDDDSELDTSLNSENAEEISNLKKETQILKEIREAIGSDDFPRMVFKKVFSDDIVRLLSMEDMWKSRKPPKPLNYETIENSIDDNNSQSIDMTTNKNIARNRNVWSLNENLLVFKDRLSSRLLYEKSSNPNASLSFDKDDIDTLDFVTATSNLRAFVFDIERKSCFDVKAMAGNIIPAIATTNAIIAGMIVMQSFKILNGKLNECKTVYFDRSRLPQVFLSESLKKPKPNCLICSNAYVSLKINTKKTTLREFLEKIVLLDDQDKTDIGDYMVTQDGRMLYDVEYDDNLDSTFEQLTITDGKMLMVTPEDEYVPAIFSISHKESFDSPDVWFQCIMALPTDIASASQGILLFNKWTYDDVEVKDISLTDYIQIRNPVYLPHTAGRFSTKRFRKAQCPIVERLTNSLMMHGRNNGKKLMAVRIVKHAFEIIHLSTDQNPIQVLVDAIINTGPREDSTRIGSAGTVRRQAVDVSPLRRVNQSIALLTIGTRESAFRNVKSIAECLADELINAAKGSSNSYAIKKKDELERVAKSNR